MKRNTKQKEQCFNIVKKYGSSKLFLIAILLSVFSSFAITVLNLYSYFTTSTVGTVQVFEKIYINYLIYGIFQTALLAINLLIYYQLFKVYRFFRSGIGSPNGLKNVVLLNVIAIIIGALTLCAKVLHFEQELGYILAQVLFVLFIVNLAIPIYRPWLKNATQLAMNFVNGEPFGKISLLIPIIFFIGTALALITVLADFNLLNVLELISYIANLLFLILMLLFRKDAYAIMIKRK